MTRLKQTSARAVALLLAATLGACTTAGNGPTASSTSPSSSSTSPKPSPATPTQSPEEVAIAAAKDLLPQYFATRDRSLQEGKAFNVEDFKKVAISSGLIEMQNRYNVITGQSFKQLGATRIETVDNPRVDLSLDLKKSPPDVPTVQLDVCIDVSKVNIVNKAGESQIPPSRVPRQKWRVGVSNYEYPTPGAWRVSFVDPQGGKTC